MQQFLLSISATMFKAVKIKSSKYTKLYMDNFNY